MHPYNNSRLQRVFPLLQNNSRIDKGIHTNQMHSSKQFFQATQGDGSATSSSFL